MPTITSLLVLSALLLCAGDAAAQCTSTCAPDGKQTSGAIYRVCRPQPSCYNGNLVIYAHGYVDVLNPIAIPEDQLTLPDGTSIPGLINSLGFAFATTSYSRNGLAILEGVRDVRDLVDIYRTRYGAPQRIYVVGPSEGGLVTAKSLEMYPGLYAGGVAACGPVGNFRGQINYMGDFRVLFDYYFPGVIPGSATRIPEGIISSWSSRTEPRVREAVRNNRGAAAQLVRVAGVTAVTTSEIEEAIVRLAWYSVFATNDAREQLGGQPFDNIGRLYLGSDNDLLLNMSVERIAADSRAIAAMQNYETTGRISAPLVTLHTTADPVIPYWHEWWYTAKVQWTGNGALYSSFPIVRYGHCQFNAAEVLFSFGVMLLQANLRPVPATTFAQPPVAAGLAPDLLSAPR